MYVITFEYLFDLSINNFSILYNICNNFILSYNIIELFIDLHSGENSESVANQDVEHDVVPPAFVKVRQKMTKRNLGIKWVYLVGKTIVGKV